MWPFSKPKTGVWSLETVEPPCDNRPSIFRHITSHIAADAKGLTEGGEQLPDEEQTFGAGQLRWVAGGLDGAFGHHATSGEAKDRAREIHKVFSAALDSPTNKALSNLYASVREGALDCVDPFLELLLKGRDFDPELDRLESAAEVRQERTRRWAASGAVLAVAVAGIVLFGGKKRGGARHSA